MKLKDIKYRWRKYEKHIYLVATIVFLVVGGGIAYLGNKAANPLVIAIGFIGLASSFKMFLSWVHLGEIRHIRKSKVEGEEDEVYIPPNSLKISPNYIEFVYQENPSGLDQRSLNDGKYYHILAELLPGEYEELKLPDDDESERYYDPTEFANPVTMVSNKKYFTWAASTMQKISIGVMAIIIGIEVLGLVMLT